MSKDSPKTVPWPLSKALAWCLTRNEEFAQEVASHDRSSPLRNSMENCSRAISVAPCSWPAVLVMNLQGSTRASEASPMMSCCPFLRLHQITRGPLESWQRIMSPREKNIGARPAHVFLSIIIC